MTPSDVHAPNAAFERAAPTDSALYINAAAAPRLPGTSHHSFAYHCSHPGGQPFYQSTDPNLYSLSQSVSTTLAPVGAQLSLPCRSLPPPLAPLSTSATQSATLLPSFPPPPCSTSLGAPITKDKPLSQACRQERVIMIGKLVDVSADIVDSIWHRRFLTHQQRHAKVVPTKAFIQEMLKRSKTTYSTLQISLFYLFRVKRVVHARLRDRAVRYGQKLSPSNTDTMLPPSPPASQSSDPEDDDDDDNETQLEHQQHMTDREASITDRIEDLMCCSRRMFLASLIVASKYLHDKNYRNSAWAKLSGLDIAEINAAEMAFLRMLDYKLYVSKPTFDKWCTVLQTYTQKQGEEN